MMMRHKALPVELIKGIIRAVAPRRPERVLVFGSYARGDYDSHSDLDIVLVCDTDLPFLERFRLFDDLFTLPMAIELLVYTPAEFEAMIAKDNPFIARVLDEGIELSLSEEGSKAISH